MTNHSSIVGSVPLATLALVPWSARAQLPAAASPPPPAVNAVTAGELVVEPPTLIALGFEWTIDGDDNRNAIVTVAYRHPGEASGRRGLPLLRLQRERTAYANTLDYVAPNMFAGSLLDLTEDTAFEVRLTLADPDGVRGDVARIVNVR